MLQWKGDGSHTELYSYRAWQEWRDLQRNRKHYRRTAVCEECLKNVTIKNCCIIFELCEPWLNSIYNYLLFVQNSLYYVGRKKIVQCLICEQKNAQVLSFSSFFFVFSICTEIKTVHVLFLVIAHVKGLLHLICRKENKVMIFFCTIIHIIQYIYIKGLKSWFFFCSYWKFFVEMLAGKLLVFERRSFAPVIPRILTSWMFWVLTRLQHTAFFNL